MLDGYVVLGACKVILFSDQGKNRPELNLMVRAQLVHCSLLTDVSVLPGFIRGI